MSSLMPAWLAVPLSISPTRVHDRILPLFPQNDVTNNLSLSSRTRGKSWTMRTDTANSDSRKAIPNRPNWSSNSLFRNILPLSHLFAGIWLDRPESKMNKPLKINTLQGMAKKNVCRNLYCCSDFARPTSRLSRSPASRMPRLYGV